MTRYDSGFSKKFTFLGIFVNGFLFFYAVDLGSRLKFRGRESLEPIFGLEISCCEDFWDSMEFCFFEINKILRKSNRFIGYK